MLQGGGGGKAIGDGVGVRERFNIYRFYGRDADVADAGDIAPLAGAHVAELPEANRLRFFSRANCGQEFLFEEEHTKFGVSLLVAKATSPMVERADPNAEETAAVL